ncbi:PP2C family protein-serine/threonine phosphatase [Swingsia samuiensis]|uniref:Serine/threonine-protein phosphatase n=1 Tax=Swingsia samuiensis TaxID=1293412 RepID=A0A4Y6UFI4_9PROT|nr:protein phosphatase 2C domain-containing protein [Swingsia samuiensis]QDH16312.1 serine/threonine-protein phosphatase [Swingsia samuiensis]
MAILSEYSYSATDKGPFRSENQDALICRPDIGVYAVADGAGGHTGGKLASTTVMDAIARLPAGIPVDQRLAAIRHAVGDAHKRLRKFADENGEGAVTTVVVLLLAGDYFVALWVGDSRIYMLRKGELIQLTHDHTLVQQMIDAGTLSPDEGKNHPQANIITRAAGGMEDDFQLDKRTGTVLPGDRFLLCSDGLMKTMDDDEIAFILEQDGDVAEALLATALRRRARDNVSVVTVVRP